jgi:hypothetical protein
MPNISQKSERPAHPGLDDARIAPSSALCLVSPLVPVWNRGNEDGVGGWAVQERKADGSGNEDGLDGHGWTVESLQGHENTFLTRL